MFSEMAMIIEKMERRGQVQAELIDKLNSFIAHYNIHSSVREGILDYFSLTLGQKKEQEDYNTLLN